MSQTRRQERSLKIELTRNQVKFVVVVVVAVVVGSAVVGDAVAEESQAVEAGAKKKDFVFSFSTTVVPVVLSSRSRAYKRRLSQAMAIKRSER